MNDSQQPRKRSSGLIAFLRALVRREPVHPKSPHEENDEYDLEKERHRGFPGPT